MSAHGSNAEESDSSKTCLSTPEAPQPEAEDGSWNEDDSDGGGPSFEQFLAAPPPRRKKTKEEDKFYLTVRGGLVKGDDGALRSIARACESIPIPARYVKVDKETGHKVVVLGEVLHGLLGVVDAADAKTLGEIVALAVDGPLNSKLVAKTTDAKDCLYRIEREVLDTRNPLSVSFQTFSKKTVHHVVLSFQLPNEALRNVLDRLRRPGRHRRDAPPRAPPRQSRTRPSPPPPQRTGPPAAAQRRPRADAGARPHARQEAPSPPRGAPLRPRAPEPRRRPAPPAPPDDADEADEVEGFAPPSDDRTPILHSRAEDRRRRQVRTPSQDDRDVPRDRLRVDEVDGYSSDDGAAALRAIRPARPTGAAGRREDRETASRSDAALILLSQELEELSRDVLLPFYRGVLGRRGCDFIATRVLEGRPPRGFEVDGGFVIRDHHRKLHVVIEDARSYFGHRPEYDWSFLPTGGLVEHSPSGPPGSRGAARNEFLRDHSAVTISTVDSVMRSGLAMMAAGRGAPAPVPAAAPSAARRRLSEVDRGTSHFCRGLLSSFEDSELATRVEIDLDADETNGSLARKAQRLHASVAAGDMTRHDAGEELERYARGLLAKELI